MKLVKVGNKVINLDHVAIVERQGTDYVLVRYAIPRAAVPEGVSWTYGSTPPVASDHYQEMYSGEEAEQLWSQL